MEFCLPCYTIYIVEKLSVLQPVKPYIRVCGRQGFTTTLNKMATLSFATVLNEKVTNPLKRVRAKSICFATIPNKRVTNLQFYWLFAIFCFATVLNERVTNPRIQFSTWNHAPAFLP